MKYILGGHWNNAPENWSALTEGDCDITKRLPFEDNNVTTIFTEHVLEHVELIDAINFFKESKRVLKIGGVLRICMPCLDKMLTSLWQDDLSKHYCDVQTLHYYVKEDEALKELNLEGIREEPIAFMMDSLMKGHNHKFVWTSDLARKVLEQIGFSEVYVVQPGDTHFDKSDCLERIIRGVNPEYVLEKFGVTHYDPESLVIEAKK